MAGTDPGDWYQEQAGEIAGLMDDIAADGDRHIPLPGTLNCRDVGGYPVAGGGAIAWRTLLRSDALHGLDTAAAILGELGLRTVLDLRTSVETQIAPSPLDGFAESGTRTTHISLIGVDLAALPPDLGDIYEYLVDHRGSAIGAAIQSLSRPGALPALVHCTAGKDRTGIVVAFALAAVGVPDRIIAADYALSSLYLDPVHTPAIGRVRVSSGMGDRLTAALMASPPGLILRVLARARQHAGTVRGYLLDQGVSAGDLDTLRAALVTDAGRPA